MLSAKDIKRIKSLGQKKFRDLEGAFVVEGEKLVREAEQSGFRILERYSVADIGEAAMERISQLSSPSPVLAVVEKPAAWDKVCADVPAPGLYLALDGIRDPGNLGTILRTADWFGISGVFASADTVEISNPKVVQATMGAIFRVKFALTDIPALCRATAASGGVVYGTFMDGANIYKEELCTGADRPVLIVIGNEANGISAETAAAVTRGISIPAAPTSAMESLNAAIAAAITIAEFRRQCAQPSTKQHG
jgi:TrmH family RNA methyltransferase